MVNYQMCACLFDLKILEKGMRRQQPAQYLSNSTSMSGSLSLKERPNFPCMWNRQQKTQNHA